MYDTDVPQLKALRDEYIKKYNKNYRWYNWFVVNDPEYPNPTYNPDFWNRMRVVPYKKYNLSSSEIYTIDEIVAVCNRRVDISENERKRDIDCLVYNNVNFHTDVWWLNKFVDYSTTFEEYKTKLTF